MNVGHLIRAKRNKLGISARELSLRAGLSPSYVSKLESGTIECSLKAFASLAWALRLNREEVHLIIRAEGRTEGPTPES